MSLPAVQSVQIHCHHCQRWVGEASTPLTFVGMFRHLEDRNMVPGPRDTYRCKSCGWVNVFKSEQRPSGQSWRALELKQG